MKNNTFRIIALVVLGGLSALGAGNVPFNEMDALDSFLFGASMIFLFTAIALLAIYVVKGNLPQADFDETMKTAVQQIQTSGEESKSE